MRARPSVEVRAERPADREAVHTVHARAFGQRDEADLVDALRGHADPWVSLVATDGDAILGHVGFSPVRIVGSGGESRAMGLAPLGVLPEHQQHGIGSLLVTQGLRVCHELGEHAIFVLGHPGYYPRFGFRPASERGLHYRDTSPEPSFMVTELAPGALGGRTGWVRFHEAFDRLGETR